MKELLRILREARRQWFWMTAGIVLGMTVITANALNTLDAESALIVIGICASQEFGQIGQAISIEI